MSKYPDCLHDGNCEDDNKRDQFAMCALTALVPSIASFEVLSEVQIISVVARAFAIADECMKRGKQSKQSYPSPKSLTAPTKISTDEFRKRLLKK